MAGDSGQVLKKVAETNVSLQHKLVDLLLGIKELNANVSELVKIFKTAAENIKTQKYEDPLLAKIDELVGQNKNLAKGLLAIEKYIQERKTIGQKPEF